MSPSSRRSGSATEPTRNQRGSNGTGRSTVASARVAARRSVEPPDTVMHRVAPQQTVQMVHPQAQPTKPVEQREEPFPAEDRTCHTAGEACSRKDR